MFAAVCTDRAKGVTWVDDDRTWPRCLSVGDEFGAFSGGRSRGCGAHAVVVAVVVVDDDVDVANQVDDHVDVANAVDGGVARSSGFCCGCAVAVVAEGRTN